MLLLFQVWWGRRGSYSHGQRHHVLLFCSYWPAGTLRSRDACEELFSSCTDLLSCYQDLLYKNRECYNHSELNISYLCLLQLINAGKGEALRIRAILRSLVPTTDLVGIISIPLKMPVLNKGTYVGLCFSCLLQVMHADVDGFIATKWQPSGWKMKPVQKCQNLAPKPSQSP